MKLLSAISLFFLQLGILFSGYLFAQTSNELESKDLEQVKPENHDAAYTKQIVAEMEKKAAEESLRKNRQEIENKSKKAREALAKADLLPKMVTIPAGRFKMGSIEEDDTQPVHEVSVSSFKLATTETTQALWYAVMAENPSFFVGDNRPVEGISWLQVQEFIAILNAATNLNYRLPSEAEWEYAARAGTTTRFFWGDRASKSRARFDVKGGTGRGESTGTAKVKSYQPNEWGLYDMHGNVSEWVADCWNNSYKDAPNDGSAWIPGNCDYRRVVRGGSWTDDDWNLRSANRYWTYRIESSGYSGFRLAQDLL